MDNVCDRWDGGGELLSIAVAWNPDKNESSKSISDPACEITHDHSTMPVFLKARPCNGQTQICLHYGIHGRRMKNCLSVTRRDED
jgi:hypothetical protein